MMFQILQFYNVSSGKELGQVILYELEALGERIPSPRVTDAIEIHTQRVTFKLPFLSTLTTSVSIASLSVARQ